MFKRIWTAATSSSSAPQRNDVIHAKENEPADHSVTTTTATHGGLSPKHSLLLGRLSSMPPICTNIVKIYVCCNNAEFETEKRILSEDILPKLRNKFLEQELEIQFVCCHGDKHGVHLDGKSLIRHMELIADCHRVSVGPFFLCLMGNKYGQVPLPATIEQRHYELIHNEAFEAGKDVTLLDKWYSLDAQCLPPSYQLVPCSKYYKHISSSRDTTTRDLMEAELSNWISVRRHLSEMIKHAASVCTNEGRIKESPNDWLQQYSLSALHQEINFATSLNPSRTIFIRRTFKDISVNDGVSTYFTDVISDEKQVDKESQQRLQELQTSLSNAGKQVSSDQNRECDYHALSPISWHPTGLAPDIVDEHSSYLKDFRQVVFLAVSRMIDSGLSSCLKVSVGRDTECLKTVDREVATCLYTKQNDPRASSNPDRTNFQVTEHVDNAIRSAVMDDMESDGGHRAVLIRGPEGCGKTTAVLRAIDIISTTATSAADELVVIPRLLFGFGKTSFDLLADIVTQLSSVVSMDSTGSINDVIAIPHEFDRLVQNYASLLRQFSESISPQCHGRRRLIIALDGLENIRTNLTMGVSLSGNLDWLSVALPSRIHVIASFRTQFDSTSATSNATGPLVDVKLRYIDIPDLDESSILRVVNETYHRLNRCVPVDSNYLTSLTTVTRAQPRPVFVTMVTEECITRETTLTSENKIAGLCKLLEKMTSLENVAKQRFKRVERQHGRLIVPTILRYLSSSLRGLTESELLDILSCNNEVCEAALLTTSGDNNYTSHLLRFPFGVWHNIRSELGAMLVERFVDNRLLLMWSHPSISQAATRRYRRQVEDIKTAHRDLANLFLETWLNGDHDVTQLVLDVGRRYVGAQPLLLSKSSYNLRRLSELWYQLLNAGDIEMLKRQALCNFEYLLARLHSSSVNALISDLTLTTASVLDPDIHLVLHTVIASIRILSVDSLQLANELIGRLRPLKDLYLEHVEPLVQQCIDWCDSYKMPLIIPLTSWLPDPRPALVAVVSDAKSSLKVCPTGNAQHIFCANSDHVINMFHVPSGKHVRAFAGHVGKITCLEMAHYSLSLWSSSLDGTVRKWDISSGLPGLLLSDLEGIILCMKLAQCDTRLVAGSEAGQLHVICTQTSTIEQSIYAHYSPITCLAINSTDTVIATGSLDKTVKIWYFEDLSLLAVFDELVPGDIVKMALSADNSFLILAYSDGNLLVRSFVTGKLCHQLRGHVGTVEALAVSSDCVRCVVGSVNGYLYVYNLRSTQVLYTLAPSSNEHAICDLRLTADDRFIFSATSEAVYVWTFQQQQQATVRYSNEHTEFITCIRLSEDGKMAVTGSEDGLVKLWNLDISDFMSDLKSHLGAITCVDIATDDAFVASGSEDMTVKVWSVTMSCVITDYKDHHSPITTVLVLNDNLSVLSAEMSGILKLWDAEHGTTRLSITGPVGNLQLALNCQLAVSGDINDSSIKLWQVVDGLPIQSVSHVGCITCVSFSPDSQYFVTGSEDMSLKVWEANTGKLTQVLVEHGDVVSCVAVADGNQYIVSGSHDNKLLIWSLDTGEVEHQLLGHSDHVTAVKITKDGTVAISGSRDETVRAWSMLHGTLITLFDIHRSIADVIITPDASRIAVRLGTGCHVPFLCLHNSPAAESTVVQSRSQVQLSMVGDSPVLPLTPHYTVVMNNDVSPESNDVTSRSFVSDSGTGHKASTKITSPIKAPLQTAVRAQEINKSKPRFEKETSHSGPTSTKKSPDGKQSMMCAML